MTCKIVVLCLILGFASCSKSPLSVDISDIDLSLKVHRIDRDVYTDNMDKLPKTIQKLKTDYPDFWNLYMYKVLMILDNEPYNDSTVEYGLNIFLKDSITLNLRNYCNDEFRDFEKQKKELEKAFKYYKYYYPNAQIPEIYTYLSGLNQSIVSAEGLVGIGLDKYLGANFEYYKRLNGVYAYQWTMMKPSQILPDVMYTWAITELIDNVQENNVIKEMVRLGKIYYFIDAMMPSYPDSVKIGYSSEQIEFCENNEKQMWSFLIENRILYSNKRLEIKRYNEVGPFTSSFSKESPGKVGAWIGWQIIKSYMENNSLITLPQLMADKDLQEIFLKSGYAP
ncbi:MAG: hypothetical protein ACK5L5_09010 [Bacteroidales bacterium]